MQCKLKHGSGGLVIGPEAVVASQKVMFRYLSGKHSKVRRACWFGDDFTLYNDNANHLALVIHVTNAL
jgi:hypothetical protein